MSRSPQDCRASAKQGRDARGAGVAVRQSVSLAENHSPGAEPAAGVFPELGVSSPGGRAPWHPKSTRNFSWLV